uniref:uncharacterized protein plekhg6 n=1 Tax=Monopterus albus TaxID=43700 RepID=UPI0009B2FBC2|nr:uncharacterized protein LOC109966238 [Monopterus albus]
METFTETRAFSKNLQSPGAVSTHQSPSPQTSKHFFQDSTETSASNNYDSKSSLNNKQNSSQSSDSHRVLKLGFLKLNQGMFWGMDGRISPDLQTMSDQEADLNSYNRRPKMKSQRRASIPNIITEGEQRLHLPSSSRYPLPQEQDTASPVSGQGPYGLHSPLEGLLERAKGRDGLKRERHLKVASVRPRYSPSLTFSTTPSLPPIDGDRDTEWEEEVELMRHRALTVSKGWKEQLVDGDEDERRNSVAFLDGVNVDWSGWCFDDDEVMDHIQPGEEGLLEGISRSLAYLDFSQAHEDGACSEV